MKFGIGSKISSLFWIAISGLTLTTIYSAFLMQQGIKTKRMIEYIYKQNKKQNMP
ncbi:hypothetical protein GCM10011391_32800 [Pullulanibacillus camelliae]|uniref:Uncharacterized protein n=1 Tax=Pullulanibacillus camelliae TaxID=1707096 RepID=A0A8J3DXE7_9BACL|nr:hypothetical protein [Pullulanibacillus camelliae]GGE51456.1 hypothetical protein GCM10011391_32800 [Pullulanibacillus camelliae]